MCDRRTDRISSRRDHRVSAIRSWVLNPWSKDRHRNFADDMPCVNLHKLINEEYSLHCGEEKLQFVTWTEKYTKHEYPNEYNPWHHPKLSVARDGGRDQIPFASSSFTPRPLRIWIGNENWKWRPFDESEALAMHLNDRKHCLAHKPEWSRPCCLIYDVTIKVYSKSKAESASQWALSNISRPLLRSEFCCMTEEPIVWPSTNWQVSIWLACYGTTANNVYVHAKLVIHGTLSINSILTKHFIVSIQKFCFLKIFFSPHAHLIYEHVAE